MPMTLRSFKGISPRIHSTCYVDPSAQIIGNVRLGEESSAWFNSVIRGDLHAIQIGRRTNIQDLCLVHVSKDKYGTQVGDDVTVGHHVVLHGCQVGNRVLIGMGAILMDNVFVEDDCVIGAGALLTPGTRIASGSLALGSPAKVKRILSSSERAWILRSAANYVGYAKEYAE
jgi:carbonic anhydrase/acetyltransferase-like protein (isoleucine patch superfamily)